MAFQFIYIQVFHNRGNHENRKAEEERSESRLIEPINWNQPLTWGCGNGWWTVGRARLVTGAHLHDNFVQRLKEMIYRLNKAAENGTAFNQRRLEQN